MTGMSSHNALSPARNCNPTPGSGLLTYKERSRLNGLPWLIGGSTPIVLTALDIARIFYRHRERSVAPAQADQAPTP